MQLYAFDFQKRPISAKQAVKRHDYFCIECGSIVHLRSGIHRQRHFYHLEPSRSCRLNGKSMDHLQVQYRLYNLFPPNECQLEHLFSNIKRIADVVWFPQKLIFEVQCSGITATELKERNEDYHLLGFRVIWILHDRQFNQWRASAAEIFLQGLPHYYTNIDDKGYGIIYDQFNLIEKGIRVHQLEQLPIHPASPKHLTEKETYHLSKSESTPQVIKKRAQSSSLYFSGDLTTICVSKDLKDENKSYLLRALESEMTVSEKKNSLFYSRNWKEFIIAFWREFIIKPYRCLLQMLLENSCQ